MLTFQAGQNLSLNQQAPGIRIVEVELGGEPADSPWPLDAGAFALTAEGQVRGDEDFIFYNQPALTGGGLPVSYTHLDVYKRQILLGAVMVLAMHAGFAFLELGTVRKKNQVNALVKILSDFAVSTIAYFFIGYSVAYGVNFFAGAETLMQRSGYELTKFFFLLTFAAAVPAIISGGIAERAKFNPCLLYTSRCV